MQYQDTLPSVIPKRLLCWFSCGAASAVAAKMAVAMHKGPEPVEVLYCELANEHPDNERFRGDVEKWLGHPIKGLRSAEYPTMDIYDVFKREQYISGIAGATCTKHLKREVRMAYESPSDIHVFGYTVDEGSRIREFERENPNMRLQWVLRDLGIAKQDCYAVVKDAGIELPAMYQLGYNNNNCIGCVKGGAGYWNKIRRDFPDHFEKAALESRRLGVRLVKHAGERCYLDELPPNAGNYAFEGDIECGPQCVQPTSDDLDMSNEKMSPVIKAKGCFRCDGTGQLCNICGESEVACGCDDEDFGECPDCKAPNAEAERQEPRQ